MCINFLKTGLILSAVLHWFLAVSQSSVPDYPVIGQPIPEFRLTNVQYYDRDLFDPREVNGKWIVMDFWETGCVACVQSFPKVDQLQREFKDHIQFILVAKNDLKYNKNIKDVFNRYRTSLGLNLSIAYDTTIFKRFRVRGVPHIVVIDPEKNVYAVTDSHFLNEESLRALIENRRPAFNHIVFGASENGFGSVWKYLIKQSETDGRDFLFRSILCPYRGELNQGSWKIDQFSSRGFYQVVRASLSELYTVAYFGAIHWNRGQPSFYNNYWRYPILNTRDSSLFAVNNINLSGLYNYSLTVPNDKATKQYLMEVMRSDLKKYFKYEVAVETRMMPYWRLTSTEGARRKLISKAEQLDYKFEPIGLMGKKISISLLIDHIESYNIDEHCPFIDETNIDETIDLSFRAVMTDIAAVQLVLQKHGLILEKSKKEFKVLVIRDPESVGQ